MAMPVLCSSGCVSGSEPTIRAGLNENFELHVGQSATVDTLALEVEFEAVTADSRCAKGVTCVWEGDAVVRLRLQWSDAPPESVELHTTANGQGSVTVDGYDISLVALGPVPVSGHSISPSEYVVTLNASVGGETSDRAPRSK